jgi:hypothetical protein
MGGDIYGSTPHIIYGEIWIENLGEEVGWLSLDPTSGIVGGSNSQQIILTYNSAGLEDGTYTCNLLVKDNFQHQSVLPVTLTIDQFLGEGVVSDDQPANSLQVFPNPFKSQLHLVFKSDSDQKALLQVYDGQGILVGQRPDILLKRGSNEIDWNSGNSPGLYYLRLITGNGNYSTRVIKIH